MLPPAWASLKLLVKEAWRQDFSQHHNQSSPRLVTQHKTNPNQSPTHILKTYNFTQSTSCVDGFCQLATIAVSDCPSSQSFARSLDCLKGTGSGSSCQKIFLSFPIFRNWPPVCVVLGWFLFLWTVVRLVNWGAPRTRNLSLIYSS